MEIKKFMKATVLSVAFLSVGYFAGVKVERKRKLDKEFKIGTLHIDGEEIYAEFDKNIDDISSYKTILMNVVNRK